MLFLGSLIDCGSTASILCSTQVFESILQVLSLPLKNFIFMWMFLLVLYSFLLNSGVCSVCRCNSFFVSGNFSQIVPLNIFSVPVLFPSSGIPIMQILDLLYLPYPLFSLSSISTVFSLILFTSVHFHWLLLLILSSMSLAQDFNSIFFSLYRFPMWPSFLCWFYFFFHFFCELY